MLSQTIIGRYEVLAMLGQGAMGTVYKAVDPLIERTVAIKTINLNLSKEERAEFEERFYREAKSAGSLSDANIVTIYDVGETDDIAYIAMEYLEGESLREVLDSGVVLPLEMISKIAARIANALNYAHENNVVHRDIKPANIMITSSRDVKIMDFGIAQMPTGSRTQLGTVLGSPKYMAPEQVAGQPTDGKTDIFALGVVLYEMLTGVTPFNGDNLSAIMYKILNEEPAPPSTLNPRVPAVFDRMVSRALAKRPEDRYQTAREFARDLRNQDAVLSQAAPRSAASHKPAYTGQANKAPTGQHDATVVLPPHQARGLIAAASGVSRQGIQEKIASFLRDAQWSRKVGLFAVPVLALAVLVMYSQPPRPAADPVNARVMPVLEEKRVAPTEPVIETANVTALPLVAPKVVPEAAPKGAPKVTSVRVVPAPNDAAAPAVVAQEPATMSFAISPWGEVFVDGKSVGVSPPLTSLKLEAGKHRVEIRNQAFAAYRDTVNLKPGQSFKVRHKFR
ncbi:MAG: serine/threonine-protein kinase [Thiobacillus sp.]|nr:serine/threonine-protein kinase [Thiobacillus sp.]